MNFSVIPWTDFLNALKQQQPSQLHFWLRRWMFTNEGVILTDQNSAGVS